MKFASIRVSSVDQNEDRQVAEMLKHDIERNNIYIDKQSGRNFDRTEYLRLKEKLRAGDEIYFHELDRLGRNKKMMKEELLWFQDNGIIVRILDVPTTLMDFSTFGELQMAIMEMVNTILIEVLSTQAETEWIKTKKRQAEGIAIAKENGKYEKCGRPQREIPKIFPVLYAQYKDKKITGNYFAKMLGYKSRTSLYNLIKDYEDELAVSDQKKD